MCKKWPFSKYVHFLKSQGLGQLKMADFFPDFGVAIIDDEY